MRTLNKLLVEPRFPLQKILTIIIVTLTFQFGYSQNPSVSQDIYFQGNSTNITQCVADLHAYGWGDKISSCQVPSGWKLVFYVDKKFCGATFTVTGDISNFKEYNWNDCVSSVDVYYNDVLQGHSSGCPPKPEKEQRPNDESKSPHSNSHNDN